MVRIEHNNVDGWFEKSRKETSSSSEVPYIRMQYQVVVGLAMRYPAKVS